MFKSRSQKSLKLRLSLLNSINVPRDKILDCLSSVSQALGEKKYVDASTRIWQIYPYLDILEKSIRVHLTQEVSRYFQTEAKLTYTLKDVEKKRDNVIAWLNETRHNIEAVEKKIEERKRQPEEIFNCFEKLYKEFTSLHALTDYIHTSMYLAMEFETYSQKPKDKLALTFESLNLHPKVKKASYKLFDNGHFAQAIFEAYKSVVKHVKDRSRLRNLDGFDLMTKTFSYEYEKATDRITRRPVLQVNDLLNQSERDEQDGFKHLFMGAALGIRNPKAHELVEQKDPSKTLEYLCFASLLVRVVDEARLNT